MPTCNLLVSTELSQARQEAFDSFRKNYADMSSINEHKKMLKIKYVNTSYSVYMYSSVILSAFAK